MDDDDFVVFPLSVRVSLSGLHDAILEYFNNHSEVYGVDVLNSSIVAGDEGQELVITLDVSVESGPSAGHWSQEMGRRDIDIPITLAIRDS